MRFRTVIFIRFILALFFYKFHKNSENQKLKAWSKRKGKMISAYQNMNAIMHSKVRLPFFDTPCILIKGKCVLIRVENIHISK